ncbi:hypothetical protein PACTADRAFT_47769 [Pachysolen tannophilus NRRL Y-2460]|uniref:Nonsense-mediated mRNA decay factor n=1 Tax=Pachysolen tannophilus NRRL Y-2460 TaxID=669874 RepID=A0A1E4U1S5_PACTA|nr:hypothetical protein PACTADRAFT_47769 [Pachysolen tannophilus NRRL Y-2460]
MATSTETSTPSSGTLETSTTTSQITITNLRTQLYGLLNSKYVDDSLLLGSITFAQNKFENFIAKDLALQKENEGEDNDYESNELLDKLWVEFHYPIIKYFQTQFQLRKLFNNFHKFIKKFSDFYISLLNKILINYNLSKCLPITKIYKQFNINTELISKNSQTIPAQNSNLISTLVYFIHKSILSLADLSRYRSIIARTYLPSSSLSKKDLDFNFNYSVELYKLCILVLPAFGEPFVHTAIIDNFKNDKFNVIYNFLRSTMTRIPSDLGFNNLINILQKSDNNQNSIILEYNEISTIVDPEKINRLKLIKLQFLCLFNYYFLPADWKLSQGILINGVSVKDLENAFFQNLLTWDYIGKPVHNDVIFKQLIMLISGFKLLTSNIFDDSNKKIDRSSNIASFFIKFMFKFFDCIFQISMENWNVDQQTEKIDLPFLPILRIILCWFKENRAGLQFLKHNNVTLIKLCKVLNLYYRYMNKNINFFIDKLALYTFDDKFTSISELISVKPKRLRFFKEDVLLKEFIPLTNFLKDFDDGSFFKDTTEINYLKLIGELPKDEYDKHLSNKSDENCLRMLAISNLGKKIVLAAANGTSNEFIKFNEKLCLFEFQKEMIHVSKSAKLTAPRDENKNEDSERKSVSKLNNDSNKNKKLKKNSKQVKDKDYNDKSITSKTSGNGNSQKSLSAVGEVTDTLNNGTNGRIDYINKNRVMTVEEIEKEHEIEENEKVARMVSSILDFADEDEVFNALNKGGNNSSINTKDIASTLSATSSNIIKDGGNSSLSATPTSLHQAQFSQAFSDDYQQQLAQYYRWLSNGQQQQLLPAFQANPNMQFTPQKTISQQLDIGSSASNLASQYSQYGNLQQNNNATNLQQNYLNSNNIQSGVSQNQYHQYHNYHQYDTQTGNNGSRF